MKEQLEKGRVVLSDINKHKLTKKRIKIIRDCNHYMVACGDERGDNKKHICLRCGLTNNIHSLLNDSDKTMMILFKETFPLGVKKDYGYYENIDYIKKLFDEAISKLPNARNKIIFEEIKFWEKKINL